MTDEDRTTTGDATSPPRRATAPWLPWAIAAMAVITAAITTFQWQQLASAEADRQAVADAAGDFMVTLTTWDATDGLEDTREELKAEGTGRFLDEIDQLFGGTLGADLEAADAVSTGEIEDVLTQSIDGDTAVVLAVAVQTLESTISPEPDVSVRSAKITLARVDGEWLVENVELLVDRTPTTDITEPEASS